MSYGAAEVRCAHRHPDEIEPRQQRDAADFRDGVCALAHRGGLSVGPGDAREMSVAPGVIEAKVVILVTDGGSLCGGEFRRIGMIDVLDPYHLLASAGDTFDGDVRHIRN